MTMMMMLRVTTILLSTSVMMITTAAGAVATTTTTAGTTGSSRRNSRTDTEQQLGGGTTSSSITRFLVNDRNVNEKTKKRRDRFTRRILEEEDGNDEVILLDDDIVPPMTACDTSLLECVGIDDCASCFADLHNNTVNWATLATSGGSRNTVDCNTAIDLLQSKEYCSKVIVHEEDDIDENGNMYEDAYGAFCRVFVSCTLWKDDDNDNNKKKKDTTNSTSTNNSTSNGSNSTSTASIVDCSKLEQCDWPGIHTGFLGDGICQDILYGCYNTAVCGYDGGDCCKDKCTEPNQNSMLIKCGADGYACRDPDSRYCTSHLNPQCRGQPGDTDDDEEEYYSDEDELIDDDLVIFDEDDQFAVIPSCDDGWSLYRVVMYDSFGDGWDTTTIEIYKRGSDDDDSDETFIFEGRLENGSRGIQYFCLKHDVPSCYDVELHGGSWSKEIMWEVRSGYSEGTPIIASGGAPMKCTFPIMRGDGNCDNTCTGGPTDDDEIQPTGNDDEYIAYKDMVNCMEQSCILQVGACRLDTTCEPCLTQKVPEHCFSLDTFVAVSDCANCQCVAKGQEDSDFCMHKARPGIVIPDGKDPKAVSFAKDECTPAQIIHGATAVMTFGTCTKFDKVDMMLTHFDENHFGILDDFEACSHSYNDNKEDHGGHTALECLSILANAANGIFDNSTSEGEEDSSSLPQEAIQELANFVYKDSESFCDCSMNAISSCPVCKSFKNFKTLLYESIDACNALDEIDCSAFEEYSIKCKEYMIQQKLYNNNDDDVIDFTKQEQCDYFMNDCVQEVGPFPAFRHLDCDQQQLSSKGFWDFYKDYNFNCMGREIHDEEEDAKDEDDVKNEDDINDQEQQEEEQQQQQQEEEEEEETIETPAPAPSGPNYTPTDEEGNNKPNYTPTDDEKPNYKPTEDDASKPNYKPTYEEEKGSSSESKKKKKKSSSGSSHFFRNVILFCGIGGLGYYIYKKRVDDGFSFNNSYRAVRRRDFGFGSSDDDSMYSGLALQSSTSFEPASLPPTPTSMISSFTNVVTGGGSSSGGTGGTTGGGFGGGSGNFGSSSGNYGI